ncbi:MtrAB system histidine kinase MtrB [Actinotalea fermentans]|uniref:Sensor histidine kinase MtrB n=1 Tax=Actinotalea fermentans TaxID=43671 RepID=A0A511YSY4_9CELL|nr:MtrAB system histidine kinase MtrB [Actinotalea fermentans]KGM15656.1 histidine kinase [Actinotalea fermentans ATCC 43279 = JCM 9966 = DSM 3133]GEN78310.1 two-component sensor histidine kinase [Actinotalea fermentans]
MSARVATWPARAARLGRRVGGRVALLVRGVVSRWRGSLQLRVISSALVLGIVAVGVLGWFLSDRVASGLYDDRREQLLADSAASSQQAQRRFTASAADRSTDQDLERLLQDVIGQLRVGGTGERREVFVLRSPGQNTRLFANDQATDPNLVGLIPSELRAAVRESQVQLWMPVGIPPGESASGALETGEGDAAGPLAPGILVGSTVTVPTAGAYELYYLYDLSPEQQTLEFLQRVLLLGAVALVVLLGALTWLVTRQAVLPVRAAARVAERLADGLLAERMTVRGVDEMATLARSFNEMAESLQTQIQRMEDLSRLQRRFVSDVSHELRTPLTTIRIAAEILHAAREDLDPAAARSAELLRTQLDRFEALLADLLEMSRFDAGAAMLDAERRDVRDVVVAAVDQASALASRRGVWLEADLPDEPVVADVDPRRVERILRNLLVNAIEHAEGTPVEVRLAADARVLAVRVRDHGIGMTPEEAEHVFDRFWRADPARARTTGGTGLGLAISQEDANLHGGRLEVWARPGQGASFRLTLPRRAGIVADASPLPLEPEEQPASRPTVALGGPGGADPAAVPDLDRLEA